jgi:methyl-accepting chemotaxis protein
MPMKILRDASTVLAAQTGRLEPQAPAKRERTPSGYNCPKANHRVKEQMMSKLSLKMKLAVGFGTLLIILVVIATVAYTAVGSLAEAATEVGRKASEKEMLVKIELAVAKGRSGSASYLLLDRNEALEVDEEGKRDYKDSIEELTPLVHSDEGKRLFSEVQHSYDNFRAVSDKEIHLRRSGKTKDAIQTLTRESDPAFKQLHENVKAFTSYLDKGLEEADKRQDATVSRCRVLILALAALGFLLGAAVSGMTIRSIRSIMSRLVATMQRVAANDLATDDAEVTTEDEIGQAGTAFNRMKNSLREMIQSIAGTAQHVASASEELSSSATQQAQSAETQKDQTAQVATAMQEMSSTVLQVSENSNKAAEASRQAAETARRGGAIVEETLSRMRAIADSVSGTAKKMDELGKSSDQIGQIVGVINDIADQTNLLALNAAIEAARAGEQGRGFAVVADEVRKLAERTTTATKEIAGMIKSIQQETKTAVTAMETGTKQVEEGVKSTIQAGDSLKEIIHMAEQVGEMVMQIATAAMEQSSASEEVNQNMEKIAKLVKESADGAQQSAKACQDLSSLAFDLQNMVGTFKLGSGESDPPGTTRHSAVTARALAASAH